jgi:hypothetical protein
MLGLGGFERTQRYDVIRRKSAPFAGRSLPTVTRWTTRQAFTRMVDFDQTLAAAMDGMN